MSQADVTKVPNSPKSKPELTAYRLREVLRYDPDTGTWCWRISVSQRKAGDHAGYVGYRGYRNIRIDRRVFRSSRLAWLYMTGEWPTDDVDHRDGNRSNDRWSNLRHATHQQNMSNARRRHDNASGYKGVSWHHVRKKWRAHIACNGVRTCLGYFSTPEDAHAAYCLAAAENFGEFANFG